MFSGLLRYFAASKEEMHKVSWPTRRDVFKYTLIVFGVTLALAIFFATLDFGLTVGLEQLVKLRQQI